MSYENLSLPKPYIIQNGGQRLDILFARQSGPVTSKQPKLGWTAVWGYKSVLSEVSFIKKNEVLTGNDMLLTGFRSTNNFVSRFGAIVLRLTSVLIQTVAVVLTTSATFELGGLNGICDRNDRKNPEKYTSHCWTSPQKRMLSPLKWSVNRDNV